MKKLSILSATLLTLGILNSAKSQDLLHKFSFGLNVGVGIPGSNFGKADSSALPLSRGTKSGDTTKVNGFAKTGFHFDVTATYMFSAHVGAMLSLGGTMNSYDVITFNTLVAAEYGSGSGGQVPIFTSGSYFVGQYLIGPYIALPLGSDKLQLELKGLVGLVYAAYPTLTGSLSGGGYSYSRTITMKGGSGFGYRVGVGVKYMVAPIIGLHFGVGYTGSNVTYSSATQSQSETYAGSTTSSTYTDPVSKTMSLSLIQVTVGVSVDL